jgi:hypothetical protein
VFPLDKSAVCFCALGAIFRTQGSHDQSDAVRFLESVVDDMDVGEFNDSHTHKEILALFDRAIKIARSFEDEQNAFRGFAGGE